jgi:signal transduction histidine kinase
MHLAEQKSLILKPKDKDLQAILIEVLSSLNISYNQCESLDDIKNLLFRDKYESIILFFDKLNIKNINTFFAETQHERQSAFIIGFGPAGDERSDCFDFYFSKEELSHPAIIKPLFQGIFKVTQKVKNQTELSAMLIHDLRSPMQSTLSYLELLQNEVFGKMNDGQQQMIRNSLRLQDQILDMLNELSDVIRFENKAFELYKTEFKTKDLLQEVVKALWIQADKKNIKISISFSEEKKKIVADRLALNRVFTNILSNAIHFSPKNGTVRISCTCQTAPKSLCQVKITDSGPGINEQDSSLIFDRYYRLNRVKGKNGFGLGLYVARLFIEAHGGTIGVYNNREGGATFHFHIPI